MLKLSYKETEALFRLIHDVPEQRARPLFARFKAFQQLDFPPREKVGRGSRVGYTFDQVLQLVSAFELLQAGAMPLRAARSVATNWPEQRRVYALAWAVIGGMVDIADSDLLAASPLALAEMGGDPPGGSPVVDPLRPVARAAIAAWLASSLDEQPMKPSVRRPSMARLLVDPIRLVRAIRDYLPHVVAVTVAEVDDAFKAVGVEAFGSTSVQGWAARRSRGAV